MKLGDKVKYTPDDENIEYLGVIVAISGDKYHVSIFALGTVIITDSDHLSILVE